jgi:hypothetical protein
MGYLVQGLLLVVAQVVRPLVNTTWGGPQHSNSTVKQLPSPPGVFSKEKGHFRRMYSGPIAAHGGAGRGTYLL